MENGVIKYKDIIDNEKYQQLKKYMAHSDITCFSHCISVANNCYKFALKHNINVNMDDLMMGALLHDYYLYDWHDKNNNVSWHGFKHHKYAKENAIRDFKINKRVQKIIYSHMFPLTFWTIPTSKEALILTLMDKKVATSETFRKYRKHNDS